MGWFWLVFERLGLFSVEEFLESSKILTRWVIFSGGCLGDIWFLALESLWPEELEFL